MACSIRSAVFTQKGSLDSPETSIDSLLEMIVMQHCLINNQDDQPCQSEKCVLEIMCQLKSSLKFPQHLKILEKDNFLWNYIVKGLCHDDGLTRKRANYLLKRAIDTPHNLDEENCNQESLVPFMTANTFKEQRKIWDDFFLVIETLEEKQVHLVKQIFNKIHKLVSKVPITSREPSLDKPFHISWILVIYRLLFQHQNNAIVKWSVHNFLKTFSSNYIGYSEFITFTCGPLLNVLNSSKHFSYKEPNTGCETEDLLTNFLIGIVPNGAPSNFNINLKIFWNRFLNAILSISWGPLPLYHVTRAISNVLKENGKCLR